MSREVDKLDDVTLYKILIELVGFAQEGEALTGHYIKKNIPFDVSPNQGHAKFFKPVLI